MSVPTSGEPIMATHMTMVTMSSAFAPPPAHSGAKVSTVEWTAKKSIQVAARAASDGETLKEIASHLDRDILGFRSADGDQEERDRESDQCGEQEQFVAPPDEVDEDRVERVDGDHARRIGGHEDAHGEGEFATREGGRQESGQHQVDHQAPDTEEESTRKEKTKGRSGREGRRRRPT